MSTMLEKAIVDAKALKDAAMKNAEALVIEKYSDQIREAVDSLLEQEDEEDLFAGEGDLDLEPEATPDAMDDEEEADETLDQIPPASVEDIPDVENPTSDSEVITFDLPDLVQAIEAEEDETGTAIEPGESHEELATDLSDAAEAAPSVESPLAEEADIDIDIDEALVDELMERLRVDINPVKSGWAGTPESQMKEYEDMALARENDDKVKEENEALRSRVAELEENTKILEADKEKLVEENDKFMEAVLMLKEKVESVNVSNAKLLYINKALENPSLNERQRRKIVEAISAAETTKEAKVIYETLQSTVGSTERKRLPKSLSEAVNRNPSLIVSSHRNTKQNQETNNFSERMKRLAGIN